MKKQLFRIIALILICCMAFSCAAAENEASAEEPLYSGEEYQELLPIGSVVLLKDSVDKLMIMGYLQALEDGSESRMYDYCGVLYPSGYESADQVFLFDHEQIDKIYDIGYVNDDQKSFMQRVYDFLANL